jgi:hypothetical protein
MVETITENSQILREELASTTRPNHVLRSSAFKYYIHDGIDACRFHLIGELTEADIADLQGCWRTAKTTLRDRKLILDVRGLNSLDDAGKKWLASMASEGAEYVTGVAPAQNMSKLGPFRKLAAIFRRPRVSSADSSTQAQ